jgi:hypothetical protein
MDNTKSIIKKLEIVIKLKQFNNIIICLYIRFFKIFFLPSSSSFLLLPSFFFLPSSSSFLLPSSSFLLLPPSFFFLPSSSFLLLPSSFFFLLLLLY